MRHAPELGRGKTQDVLDQLVSQSSQHALTDNTTVHVDDELEATVDQHEGEEDRAQRHQVGHLVEFVAEQVSREVGTVDRLVDDDLGQIEDR